MNTLYDVIARLDRLVGVANLLRLHFYLFIYIFYFSHKHHEYYNLSNSEFTQYQFYASLNPKKFIHINDLVSMLEIGKSQVQN